MIKMEERRRYQRYPVYCPLQYKCADDTPRDSSITINVSEGGALLSTRRFLEVGRQIIVKVYLKNKDFFVRSRVVHVQKALTEGLYNIGIEFIDKSVDFMLKFYEELEVIMMYQRKYAEEMGTEISLADASIRWYKDTPGWQ